MFELRAGWVLCGLVGCAANDEFSQQEIDFERRRAAVVEVVGEDLAARLMNDAERRADPAFTLRLANGNAIEWYEVLEGIPIAVESGVAPSTLTRPMKIDASRAGELFSALMPTAELPMELAALDRRQRELEPAYRELDAAEARFASIRLPSPPPSEPSAAPLAREPGSPGSHCLDHSWCGRAGLDWAQAQRDRTLATTLSHPASSWVDATTCVSSGTVTHRVRYRTWWAPTAWFATELEQGTWLSAWTVSKTPALAAEAQITELADGDIASQCLAGLRPASEVPDSPTRIPSGPERR